MITRIFKRTALVVVLTAAVALSFGGQQAAAETVIKIFGLDENFNGQSGFGA